jgi:anaerobic selenocysteine-containing dehydrogenase
MTKQISRRDFLKLAAVGAGATAVLTGCGPASRYVVRTPYTQMPEYTYNGQSTYYATTCRECPAGCGLVVRTHQGRALKVEGNQDHPVNLGKTCARGQAAIQGLYNPDRIEGPARLMDGNLQATTWDEAIAVVRDALSANRPDEIAFLLGPAPDHLYDLVSQLTAALGGPAPLRTGAYPMFEARRTLRQASAQVLGADNLPFFDLGNADVVFSFGANFLETWLSPVAFGRGFARMRRGRTGRRGFLVQFEPRLSQTGATADEWIPVIPGSEALLAAALGRLTAEARGGLLPAAFREVDVEAAAQASGVSVETLTRLAGVFAAADHPLVLPGGAALGQSNGLETALAVLTLNALIGNPGQPGGVFVSPADPLGPAPVFSSPAEINDLIERMRAGRVKALFIHGVNPVFELPAALGFAGALETVPQVISFASFPDETAARADYIFPDHTPLESWGYQKVRTGSERMTLSGSQPVVVPFHDTHATADVLLAAVQAIGGDLAAKLPYSDEVDFLQQTLTALVPQPGFFNAPEIRTFMASFQQHGGWWSLDPGLTAPSRGAASLNRPLAPASAEFSGGGEFHLLVYPSPLLGDGSGANRPWLQETPDPMTTVMWNSWVEIHPLTAEELGLQDNDVVQVISPYGSLEAPVYKYPAIQPGTVAIPFGQGHTAYGRYAQGRGANPAALLGLKLNGAGDLAFAATKVELRKTGRTYELARLESRIGVYGDGLE